jgi:addiction module HigA family antidote
MADKNFEGLQRMSCPPSAPGEVLLDLLECNDLTLTEAANRLGVGRITISNLVNGHRALSEDMAHRLGRFFGNGPAFWLRLQQQLDLWEVLHENENSYEKIEPLAV